MLHKRQRRIVSFLLSLNLVFNSLYPTIALAQEFTPTPPAEVATVTPDPTDTPTPTEAVSATPTPDVTVTPEVTPTIIPDLSSINTEEIVSVAELSGSPVANPSSELSPTPSPAIEKVCLDNEPIIDTSNDNWNINLDQAFAETKEPVKLGVKYNFPLENKVSVTFKCLPKDESLRTGLKIEQVKVSDLNLPEGVTSSTEFAYDITTGMSNGTFEYDVTLPKEENKFAEVAFIEQTVEEAKEEVKSDKIKVIVETDEVKVLQDLTNTDVKVTGLDHFTIYFVQSYKDNAYIDIKDTYSQGETVYGKATRDSAANMRLRFRDPSDSIVKTCAYSNSSVVYCDYPLPAQAPVGQWDIQIGRCDDDCDKDKSWHWEGYGEDHFSVITSCGGIEIFEKTSDYSDAKVSIDFSNDREKISVSAGSGYAVTKVELDVNNDNHSGYYQYATTDLHNFNPNPGDNITKVRVEITKVCSEKKVSICHSTNSQTNSYTSNNVSINSTNQCLDVNGHGKDPNDIIPPFTYETCSYPGLNWSTTGQAIYNNGCSILSGTIIVHKDVQSPSGSTITDTSANFSVQLDGIDTKTLTDGGTVTYDSVPTGSHTVTESFIPTGYSIYGIGLTEGTVGNDSGLTVSVANNQTTHVYITNRQLFGNIVVYKDVKKNDGTEVADNHSFTALLNGASDSPFTESTATNYTVDPGVYSISEAIDTSYTNMGCKLVTGAPATDFTVTPGDLISVTCINYQKQASIGCGDGNVNQFSEACDDGNSNDSDYCHNNCSFNNICLTDGTNMLVNGDFESPSVTSGANWDIFNLYTPMLGWTTSWFGGSTTFNAIPRPANANLELHRGVNGWLPNSGSQYAELDSDWDGPSGVLNGEPASLRISQNLPTISGYDYEVKYHFSPRPNESAADNKLQSSWGGLGLGDTSSAGGTNTSWSEQKFTVSATSSSTELSFTDEGTPNSLGTFIDNVSVKCLGPREYCGDGIVNGVEKCDGTAGVTEHYTCTKACILEYVPYCGDGIANSAAEECDGTSGVTTGENFCSRSCKKVPIYSGGDVCPTGFVKSQSPVTSATVLGTDVDGETFALTSGGKYLFEASGTFAPTSAPGYLSDAGYTLLNDSLSTQYGIAGTGEDYAAHALLANLGAGVGVVNWGSYSPTHTYTKYFSPTSSAVQFVIGDRYSDWFSTSYQNQAGMGDNSGSLNLNVFECQPVSEVTVCKTDPSGTPLPGWQVSLYNPTAIESIFVPATNGSTVSFSPIVAGDYVLKANGQYTYRPGTANAEYSDAGWSKRATSDGVYGGDFAPWVKVSTFPSPNTGWLGVMVDGDTSDWGTYFNPAHTYFKSYAGYAGGTISMKILDDVYSDNSGGVTVDLHEGYTGVTGDNGCVTFSSVPLGNYQVDETEKFNWNYVSGRESVTVDSAAESFTLVNREIPKPVKLMASKVVCDSEAYLPNDTQGDITATTALNWVNNSQGHCQLATNWNFQWATAGAGSYGDFQKNTSSLGSPWTTFTAGQTVEIADVSNIGGRLETRELFPDNTYVPFSNAGNNSAEFYCTGDAANYDNWEWINNPQPGTTYYCVAFNAKQTGKITIVKETVPNNDLQTFNFQAFGTSIPNGAATTTLDDNSASGTPQSWVFTDLLPGLYEFYELQPDILKANWRLSDITCTGDSGSQVSYERNAAYVDLSPNEDVTCTFTNTKLGIIDGHKFIDQNGNKNQETGEPYLTHSTIAGGVKIFIDTNLDGVYTTGERTVNTDNAGYYKLDQLVDDTYQICEQVPTGWVASFPSNVTAHSNCQQITIRQGETVAHDFGNFQNATVTFNKNVINFARQDTPDTSTFTMTGDNQAGQQNFSESSPAVFSLKPGTYTFNETGIPENYVFDSVQTPGRNSTRNQVVLTLASGEVKDFTVVNRLKESKLLISKFNNIWPVDTSAGGLVQYTVRLEVLENFVRDIHLTDLPPTGFKPTGNCDVYKNGVLDHTYNCSDIYHSPANLNLGSGAAGDIFELVYNAAIDNSQKPGLYKDLAWGYACQTDEDCSMESDDKVLASSTDSGKTDSGVITDQFVGTKVNIDKNTQNSVGINVEKEEKRTGEVLGASTDMLPATGVSFSWTLLALLSLIAGFVIIFASKIKSKTMKIFLSIILASIVSLSLIPARVYAAGELTLRVEDPKSPTNDSSTNISFTALDMLGRPVTVQCLKKGPTDVGFTTYGSLLPLGNGGNSGECPASTQITSEGTYQFQVIATPEGDTPVSAVVSLDYKTSGPGTPSDYSKSKDSCTYKIHFKSADDGGKTVKVEVYRSDNKSFTADSGSLATSVGVGSNTEKDILNTVPECNKEYFYAIRAFDSAGNGSSTVGDSFTTYITSGTTTTTTTNPTQGVILVGGNTKLVSSVAEAPTPTTVEGQIDGSASTQNPNATPTVLGESTTVSLIKKPLFIFGTILIALVSFILIRRLRSK